MSTVLMIFPSATSIIDSSRTTNNGQAAISTLFIIPFPSREHPLMVSVSRVNSPASTVLMMQFAISTVKIRN